MGAESSVQRDGKSQEDASASASASAEELSAEVNVLQEGGSDAKPLQKNGQISSMTSLNGHSEDNTLAEVGQPDGVSVAQKEEAPETMDTIQDEVAPQVNGEKMEKESPDANDISAIEEKAAEEKPDDASEVGFKKIFRFVGFKFTLKKDKSEEKDPVKLLTVKEKEGEEVSGTDEPTKEEEAATAEEKSKAEEKDADIEASTAEAEVIKDSDKAETTDAPAEGTAAEATDEAAKEEGAEKEGETTPPSQETTLSPFRKLFSGGLFSNLRKKASIKKTKEEEDKEAAVEEETAKTEETAAAVEENEKNEVDQETQGVEPATPEEEKREPKEEAPATPEEAKSETTPEPEDTVETPAPAAITTDETKQEEEKAELNAEEQKGPAEVTSEAELLSSQEKAKSQGSPLKKLFTGAGLMKLSTKKQKTKKDTEIKFTESGEQAAEQLQSSTESAEAPKADSGPSSPEESEEHVIAVEVTQNESSQETEGEIASDGEKKKEGIIAWSSFKKLVTPKKRVKRSSESEDEATSEKPAKSATLSSSESATLADKSVEEEAKEDKPNEEEPKTENNEKLVSSTEEPKKKMDTSVSWEALMCMGGPKKRTRRTSDSDDEETKIEEVLPAAAVEGEQEGKTEAAIVTSQNTESEGEVVSSPEPLSSPPERESAWDTLKRIVMSKNKTKEEKQEETAEQVQSDSEAPKDESSFSLKKFLPGRRKKKAEKQASTEQGSGEEDTDTPAVVPLSEYDDQVEAEQEAPAEPAAVQIKVSAEDRSPSWIPAIVEDTDDKHDELSDIPEEAENAATPKSVDTDVAEDETEDEATPLPKALGRRLSTAEVKPVSPAPAAEITPVPQGPKLESADKVLVGIEAQISEIPPKTSVTAEDVPIKSAFEKTEYEPPTENAESKTNTILEPHTHDKATAICTGLGTKEIAKVALEKPVMPIIECVAVIHDVLSTEVSKEEKPESTEETTVIEDAVLRAQVHQVETTKLERLVENSLSEVDIQAANKSYEPEIEMVGIVSTVAEESEVIQSTTMSENSPKAVVVNSISPTLETAVCTQSVEVTEPTVETKEAKMDVEQLAASEENIIVKEVVQCVTEEISSTITKETQPATPVFVPSEEEVAVITKTVVLVAPISVQSDQVATNASLSEPVSDEPTQVQETKEEGTVVDTTGQTAESEICAVIEQATEIEAQSMVIAQAVIQDAMDKVSEDAPKPKKPTTPTDTIPEAVQAVATTEKEIEITTETHIITAAPVAMEVIDTIPVEVIQSLDASVEEEKKLEKGLKKAEEVKVSEETVIVEEVVEIKAESQTGEELEQVKEEQSKEDTEVQESDVKEAAEEVKPQLEEAKSEETSEENKEKVLEIHMPVQVVLQTAQVIEAPSVEEEPVVEFDSNGPVAEDVKAESTASETKLSTLTEEPQVTASAELSPPSQVTEAAASQPETEKTSVKCAEVMAQVIEVIEEAVKEIEPVSTEITAAS
ncbi:A-kinase anchor protein 12b isoform X3 [Siniperca chuatsi]|uniref:A-kinase anchor protein 12b isoform X2 n=1 Tax=Siniperca chuatsi TaxID=119488 RepID=UPI001CE1B976|nr:A-kinase anchor protein 12b isoform X2 [Siniperca chuatsi]XP_044024380.1 A-kinase anchor protein 12b isoform X3 [Siniperca chuatsi]